MFCIKNDCLMLGIYLKHVADPSRMGQPRRVPRGVPPKTLVGARFDRRESPKCRAQLVSLEDCRQHHRPKLV